VKYIEFNNDYQYETIYELNDILLGLSFLRVYFVIRMILVFTIYTSPRSQRVCEMNGCEANALFAIRSIMKEKPYTILVWSMILSTALFGY
jgi:hypothetical protein